MLTKECLSREDGESERHLLIPHEHKMEHLCTPIGGFPGKIAVGERIHKIDVYQCVHCKSLDVRDAGPARIN